MIYYNVDDFDYELLEVSQNMKNNLKNAYPYILEFEERLMFNHGNQEIYCGNIFQKFLKYDTCMYVSYSFYTDYIFINKEIFSFKQININNPYFSNRNILVFMNDKKLYSKIKLTDGKCL